MGERRAHRGLPPRSNQQILDSEDMYLLSEVARGRVIMTPAIRADLRRLTREDLITAGFGTGQLATLLPRAQRLLEAARGEYQLTPDA